MDNLIAIITSDDPKSLGRCVREAARSGYSLRVYDRSTSPALINENKEVLRAVARAERISISYASGREVGSFVQRLDKLGIDPNLIAPAMEGLGGARNQILLDTIGSKIVMLEDSVVPDFRVVGSYDYVQFKSYPKPLSADPSVFKTGDSPDAAVSEALTQRKKGKGITSLFDLLGLKIEALRAEYINADKLVTGDRSSGKVLAAQVGYVGHTPGTSWQGHGEVQGAIRGYTSSPRQLTFQPASHLRAFVLALDNSGVILPPFLPCEGAQGDIDAGSLYGPLLSKAIRSAYSAFIPEVVMYRPPGTKATSAVLDLPPHTFLVEVLRASKDLDTFAQLLIDAEVSGRAEQWATYLVEEASKRVTAQLDARISALTSDPLKTKLYSYNLKVRVKIPTSEELRTILSLGRLIKVWPNVVEASKLILNNRSNALTVTL